jgi:hypothetical protein
MPMSPARFKSRFSQSTSRFKIAIFHPRVLLVPHPKRAATNSLLACRAELLLQHTLSLALPIWARCIEEARPAELMALCRDIQIGADSRSHQNASVSIDRVLPRR